MISFILLSKYKQRGKTHQQIKTISNMFFFVGVSLFFLIIAEFLHYYYSFEVDKTELGIISSYSLSLAFVILAGKNLFQFNWELFPSLIRKNRDPRLLNYITWILIILMLVIPGSFNNILFPGVYVFKYLSAFIYIMIPINSYIKSSYRVYTFVSEKALLRKIIIFDVTLIMIIIAYIFAIISKIYETFFGVEYSWAYFTFTILLLISSILGFISMKSNFKKNKKLMKMQPIIN